MECLIAIGTSIAGKIAEYTVAPVGRQLGYIFLYRRNVDNLKTESQDLDLQKKKMEFLVDEAKRRGDEIHDDIKDWLSKVGKITEDTEKLLGDGNAAEMKCTFKGSISYLASRYQLCKKAKEMAESVVKIKGKVSFDNISYRPKLQSNFENEDYQTSVTREKFVDEIMEVLGDSNVRTIGLHGMPGVGKTTLVKEIARKALSKDWRLFDDAVIITVSQTPDHKKIQQEVAERLGLKFDKEIISERALELQKRLKDEKKFLVVVDDIWNDELKLQDVGIVFESGQKGCKILITSRFERVLGIDMDVDKNFKADILSEDEATKWFKNIVGDAVKTRGFQQYGNKIVRECGRLPLAIVTVAHSLKYCDELPSWRDTWRQLQRSEHSDTVHSAIKLCYDKLQKDEAKQLFLLCALHEEDESIKMEYLMRYSVAKRNMLKCVYTLQEARDSVYCLVKELKNRCLLLDGDRSGTVKMHDVVRDIAISIAKESHDMHCFRGGAEVEEFLKQKKFEDLKAISLPYGYLDELIFENYECSQLELIICTWWKKSLQTIPGHLFEKTKQLRVLDFSWQKFDSQVSQKKQFDSPKVLASSLLSLQNLRTLCLRRFSLEDISLIGELKSLEILDLSGSKIIKVPGQIGQLNHLRMLDLSGCSRLNEIEPNVILHLQRLEELYVDGFKNWHKVQVNNGERRNAGLDELNHLLHLTTLELLVPQVTMLPEDLLSQQLERYKIKIGVHDYNFKEISGSRYLHNKHTAYDFPKISGSRYLYIKHTESSLLLKHGLQMLLKRSEVLCLDGLNGVNTIMNELHTESFPELKHFTLKDNYSIQYLVYLMGQIHPCTVFGSLDTLCLINLRNLKEIISNGELTVESFKTLRVVQVKECYSLKKLLPFSTATQLEELEIVDCENMKEIFTHEIQEDNDDNEVIEEFPQLHSLKLEKVSSLRKFCSKTLKKIGSSKKKEEPFVGDSVMPLFNGKFLCFPKLEKMELSGCDIKKIWDDQLPPTSTSFRCLTKLVVANCQFLKCVFSSAIAASFELLKSLEVRDCSRALEEIMSMDERMDKISFPKLEYLFLKNLEKVATFSSEIFIEFPMLTYLHITLCPEFKTFVSKSSKGKSCTTIPSLFNERVAFPSLTKIFISGMDSVEMIWQYELFSHADSFSKLEEVQIYLCKNLMKIFPFGMHRRLCNLNWLEISHCKMVEEIFEIRTSNSEEIHDRIISTQLEYLTLRDLPNLKYVWSKDPQGTFTFPNLKNVCADCCRNLKAIFPHSVVKGLSQLSILRIEECGIEEIVGKEEGLETVTPDQFVFPQLVRMELKSLPNLVCFYSGPHTSRFPVLETLEVKDCLKVKAFSTSQLLSFQGRHGSLFSTKVPFGRDQEISEIKLCKLPNLMHLMEEEESSQQPQTHLLFQHFIDLRVLSCGRLKKLVPSSISFQNLTLLVVSHCNGMIHLLSSQTAKSMKQLTFMIIRKCKRMEEIIADAGVDSKAGEIVFTQLQYLILDNLPSLASFYSGNCKMGFPNLGCVFVTRCFEMQSFSKRGVISTPNLKKVSTKRIIYYRELKLGSDSESESEPLEYESDSESESETESSSDRMIDINTIIANHWMSHLPGIALQELYTEKDLDPSNLSDE